MRNMQGQKFISRVNFETSKHHRQALREQIKPQLFYKLELSQNPAKNYIDAYKNVFKDELEKTMELHHNKKIQHQYQNINDKAIYSLRPVQNPKNKDQSSLINHIPQSYGFQKSISSPHLQKANNSYLINSNFQSQNKKFRDYFEERTIKFQNLIKNNFDGGQQFFKVQDAYREKRMRQTQSYAEILRKQLQQKQSIKLAQRQKENMQKFATKKVYIDQQELERQRKIQEYERKHQSGIRKLNEVEQQRQRRQIKQNRFQYNNISLHNPITNPIEYHIDNPYILKKIQDKTFR